MNPLSPGPCRRPGSVPASIQAHKRGPRDVEEKQGWRFRGLQKRHHRLSLRALQGRFLQGR